MAAAARERPDRDEQRIEPIPAAFGPRVVRRGSHGGEPVFGESTSTTTPKSYRPACVRVPGQLRVFVRPLLRRLQVPQPGAVFPGASGTAVLKRH